MTGLRLAVNGWRSQGVQTGVGRYLNNIVSRWTTTVTAEHFAEINFYTPARLDPAQSAFPENIDQRIRGPLWKMLVWENLRLAPLVNEDVLFCPSYSRPLLVRGRTVVVTHDVTHRLHPDFYPKSVKYFYDHLYRWSAHHAFRVITSTEAARQDIHRVWNVPLDKIRVVPLAAAEIFEPVRAQELLDSVAPRFLDAQVPYFLFVGKLAGRRNLPLLLQAFAQFKRNSRRAHKLLLVGIKLERMGVNQLIAELEIEEDVRQSGFVADADLNLIYNAAQAFVMPSTYETLSFPIMESQAVGTPVICVDAPGSREVTGGAALLIRELQIDTLSAAMEEIAEDEDLRRDLGERGLENSRGFSWQRTATRTLEILAEAGRNGRE